jgi:hypothetical protein
VTRGGGELWRALGAVADNPRDARIATRALGLPVPTPAEHTEVFVLNCPPYASTHLGPEGGIGGDAADRVAGFWRAIHLDPPPEPDHLTSLFALYAHLGEGAAQARRPATAAALARVRTVLLWEHMWSWLPNYLDAVTDLAAETLGTWADLTRAALQREARSQPGGALLPAALRESPPPLDSACAPGVLIDGLVRPVRSGFVLTRRSLAVIAQQAGTGYRIGERRFALLALLDQDPHAALAALATEAARWSVRRGQSSVPDAASRWWANRSAHTAAVLARAVKEPAGALERLA